MQKIRCVVERITYQNPENGYSVLKCRVKDYSELVPVIGNMIDTFAVIEDNVETLIEIEGIGKKRVQMIAESWERQKEVKNIMLFLQDHQVSTSYAAKILLFLPQL